MPPAEMSTDRPGDGEAANMGHHDPFLGVIRDAPHDDGPRLVYADWLEERGDTDRAELIRIQCELARWWDMPWLARWKLQQREKFLIDRNAPMLIESMIPAAARGPGVEWGLYRGLPSHVTVDCTRITDAQCTAILETGLFSNLTLRGNFTGLDRNFLYGLCRYPGLRRIDAREMHTTWVDIFHFNPHLEEFFHPQGARQGLRNFPNLRSLGMQKQSSYSLALDLLLHPTTRLRHLDLGIQARAEELRGILSAPQLRELRQCHLDIDPRDYYVNGTTATTDSIREFQDAVASSLPGSLRALHFECRKHENLRSIGAVANLPELEEFQVNVPDMSPSYIRELAASPLAPRLKHLGLHGAHIYDENYEDTFDTIQRFSSLRSLTYRGKLAKRMLGALESSGILNQLLETHLTPWDRGFKPAIKTYERMMRENRYRELGITAPQTGIITRARGLMRRLFGG